MTAINKMSNEGKNHIASGAFSVRPWHGEGVILPANASFDERYKASGFSKVEKVELQSPDGVASGFFGLYREGRSTPYGVSKDQYEIVQDETLLRMADEIAKVSGYGIETSFLLSDGSVGVIALKHGESCPDNPANNYRVLKWTHDGKGSIKTYLSSVLAVCWNTLNAGLREGKGNGSLLSAVHKAGVHTNLKQWELQFIEDEKAFKAQAEVFERMKERQTTPKEVAELAERIAGIKAEDLEKEGRGLTIKRNAIDELFSRSVNSDYIGARSEYKGSLWEPYMVATETLDHGSPNAKTIGMERQFTTTYQNKSNKITELFEELLERPVGENSSYEFQHLVEFGSGPASVSFMDLPIVKG